MSGTIRLSQDLATLINSRQGSDIQFKIGGDGTSTLQENGETIYNESETVTLYAHSCILRCRSQYFATMLDEEKNWKESSKCVIYKPNISPSTFQDVLHYIYTGIIPAKTRNIVELIAAADEMNLEELSIGCQNELICTFESIFSDGDDGNGNIGETFEGSTKCSIPIDTAIRTHVIPALNLANNYSLSHLSQRLLTVMLSNMPVIIKSPDAYTIFINNISSEALSKIIASDNLAMTERSIWDLTLDWACHQTNLSKAAVEARLSSLEDDNEGDNEESSDAAISDTHLNQFKITLAPLLPSIRFSLLDSDDYELISDSLIYLLPRRRFSEINRYFISTNPMKRLDTPRTNNAEQKSPSKIVKFPILEPLKKSIFETGGITGCSSLKDLKFELLFRASEHGFEAGTFHRLCDSKGPTLTLIRSADGYLFGGVNFIHWKSTGGNPSSPLNFLFALPDGYHRKTMSIFQNTNHYESFCCNIDNGPWFMSDLRIVNSSNTNRDSYSYLPNSYNGNGASNTALAGAQYFTVSDYEVFAIFK